MRTRQAFFSAGVLYCLAAGVAHADFMTAEAAYAKQDFAAAFQEFHELAELGNAAAQESIAIMYVNGEGTTRDNVLGYAWAKLAQEQGGGEASKGIVAQLEPRLTDTARKRVAEVTDQFGQAALQARILPRLGVKSQFPVCQMTRPVNPDDYYPGGAIRSRISGQVLVETPVMPDGHARNPRIIYSIPKDVFSEAGRRVALDTQYAAPIENGVRVRCTIRFKVKFGIVSSSSDDLKDKSSAIQKEAEAGNPASQFLHGMVLESRPDLNPNGEMPMNWYLRSAQGGSSSGQFMLGFNTFKGFGAERDEAKGLFWLDKAASHGQVNAQVALANYLMVPGTTPADHAKALDLLDKAVTSGNTDARYYLAALLAAGPEADKLDPQRALALLEGVMRDVDVDPSSFEIRAAAHARLGQFDEAQTDQKKAISIAKKLGWDLKPLEERRDRYAAGQTWSGELMVY